MTKDKWKTIGKVFESVCVRAVKVMVVAIMGFVLLNSKIYFSFSDGL